MKRLCIGIILFSVIFSFGDSTITFPTKDQLQGSKKDFILKITIPNELEDKDKEKVKSVDFSYFDLDPFKKVDRTNINWDVLKTFPGKGLVRRTRSVYLCKDKAIQNEYDLFLVMNDVLENIERKGKDQLLEDGVTREDIQYIEKLYFKDFPKFIKKASLNSEDLKARIDFLKKQFLAGKGEVRVLRVETNDAGETMIHLRLSEED